VAFPGFAERPVRFIPLDGRGPEDVVVLPGGDLVTGVEDGRILRVGTTGQQVIADTGGRPLGIEPAPGARLIVCDAQRGLLRLDLGTGELTTLVPATDVGLCDNAAVAPDGTVYFTDSSRRHDLGHYPADVIEHVGTGRVMRRSPGGRVDVLHTGLQFANGIALSPDGSFLVVAESGSRLITRVRLDHRIGHVDTFAADLPGHPDNITTGPDGTFWVALPRPRSRVLDAVQRLPPAARRVVARAARPFAGTPARRTGVIELNASGEIVGSITVPRGRYRSITGARANGRRLYLGSLAEHGIAVLDLHASRKDRG
jgi:sugar lactone lactonase YvrE